ncbi:hypothetical protein ACHAXT_010783 [Thalassiosira profunda]
MDEEPPIAAEEVPPMAEEVPLAADEVFEAAEAAAAPGASSLPLLAGLGLAVVLLALVLRFVLKSDKVSRVAETKTKKGDGKLDNKVQLNPQADAAYLVNCLRPDSTPLEILYAIATTPDNVALTSKHLALAADLREKKAAHLKEKENEASHKSMDDLFDDDGWAEEDEDDPAAAAAKKAKEEKEKEAKRLAKATGKDVTDFTKIKLEGIDEGVLGQKWVVKNLTKVGAWPPPSLNDTLVKDKRFSLDGKIVGPLAHPGVERNLIMTMGRLNAKALNTHPELMEAGPQQRIDPTYFQATMEYRQRVGGMLEATLKMASTLRSYRLARSVLDAIVMFKIGLMSVDDADQRKWFSDLMKRQYGPKGTPKLVVEDKFLGVPAPEPAKDEDGKEKSDDEKKEEAERNRIAQRSTPVTTTDDKMALEMQITRQHAEAFTKEKLAQCQKQGVPPQIALSAYRESWFILVRAKKIGEDGWDGALGDSKNGADPMELLAERKDGLYEMLEPATVKAFKKEFSTPTKKTENKIVIGWPFVISNVAQKTGRVKIHLPPPTTAGKYEFDVTIRSQEFLGVGEEFKIVVDVAEGEAKEDAEGKKDK